MIAVAEPTAAARLRELLAVDPARVGALRSKAQWELFACLRGLGELEGAATVLQALADLHGPLAKILDARAQLWPLLGRDEEAIGVARERVERFPSATGELALARTYLATGQLEEAATLAERIRDRQPDSMHSLMLLGQIALEQGDGEAATEIYEQVLRALPESVEARRGLARAQVALGEEDGAAAALRDFARTIGSETPAGALTAWAELADDLGDDALSRDLRARARALWAARAAALVPELAATPVARDRDPEAPPLQDLQTVEEEVAAPPETLAALEEFFGFNALRPGQARVLEQVLAGADTLATMPTGAGKSLCYQLPAMLLPGVTVVISPLIALMQDQVGSLPPAVAARTTLINSTLGASETRRRQEEIARGRYKLVYAAPERLRQAPFLRALAGAGVSLLVVDEAHCISLWGHDFRPDYLIVPRVLPALGQPQVLALTATATPEMAREIGQRLGRDLARVQVSLYRPNLFYEVRQLSNKEAKLRATVDICRETAGSGIIYVNSREGCEQLATLLNRELKRRRYDPDVALAYHAGFAPDERAERMQRFMDGEVRIMVATVAFGMGVDKADVRFIVHFAPPKSLEAYAQESGRAGRDGQPARCVLLYAAADKANLGRWAKRDEFDIATLRRCYAHLRRVLGDGWGVVGPDDILPDGQTADGQDVRVALGILERAELLERHPDAPRSLEVGLREAAAIPAGDRWPRFLAATGLRPGQERALDTIAVAAALDCSPAELEQLLFTWAEETGALRVGGAGRRDLCLRLVLPPPPAAAAGLPRLLEDVARENEARVARMVGFATGRACRHAALAAHLGERLSPCGASCDVCTASVANGQTTGARRSRHNDPGGQPTVPAEKPPAQVIDARAALTVLECLGAIPFNIGKSGLGKVLAGSIAASIKGDRVRQFGALAGLSQGRINGLVERLIADGFIARDDDSEYRTLSPTAAGRAADLDALAAYNAPPPAAGKPVREHGEHYPAEADDEPLTAAQAALLARLKSWRTEQAGERAVPPYIIAHDRQLREVATRRPASHDELLAIKGFGPAKVATYGDELLALLRDADQD